MMVRAQARAIEPEVVAIPAGYLLMGCETGRDDEKPVRRIWVSAFEVARYAVTNAEYARFLDETGRERPPTWNDPRFNDPRQPVVAVSWFDAAAYAEWLSAQTGRVYRLPTEAEWEKAARGGLEGKLYSWGDEPPESLPDYAARWRDDRPEPVGLYRPNGFGLYNMGDNVHEWCLDWYDAGFYRMMPERDPCGPSRGARRASRGGSWRHKIKISRCAARSSIDPSFKYTDYGFRLVRCIPGETPIFSEV